ncbi:MAG: EmrA/EmrK family multidrug efflux transporter periplasmic adaptor subunit [Rhodanobacter denitrificans]|uniref:EmrA/EmrK family multidrug efflux transporter periplasmic adaptor subunit n=1 Tax=Rhodanobacter denitrificans TaxID=666685 RepID=A0A2W5KHF4_9GAMM|nr:MAG: EmrA/EmrK family multidrug efflux transporter periplasmic adaptor subunit [Rhodanobacter denitrificans]
MSSPNTEVAATTQRGRRRRLLSLLTILLVAAGVAWAAWYWLHGRWFEHTEDAYVQGNVVQITPQTAGTVIGIGADDGDFVRQGQPLATLDPSDADVALAQAEAGLAASVRQVRGLYSNVDSGRAQVAAQKVAVDRARADFRRRQGLAASGAISAEELAHARDALAAAETSLAATQEQLVTTRALVDDTVIASHPDVQAASARLRAAFLDRARVDVLAPVSGYVARRSVQVGQRVQPGAPLMAVIPLDQVWVDANFKETQLRHMRIGQEVELESDLYGGEAVFKGRVQSLGAGTGSAFSLLPAQNASGNWIKIVQRLPVRIALDPGQLKTHPLRIGLSMQAQVNLHDRSGPVLAEQPPAQAPFATDVYAGQLGEADALIARIIHANSAGARDAVAAKTP